MYITKGNPWVPGVELHLLVIRSYILDYHSNIYFEDYLSIAVEFNSIARIFSEIHEIVILNFLILGNFMASKESDSIIEQRTYIKFRTKLGFVPKAIFEELIILCPDSHLLCSRVCEWAARFRGGRVSVEDDLRPGPEFKVRTDENIARIKVGLSFLWAFVFYQKFAKRPF